MLKQKSRKSWLFRSSLCSGTVNKLFTSLHISPKARHALIETLPLDAALGIMSRSSSVAFMAPAGAVPRVAEPCVASSSRRLASMVRAMVSSGRMVKGSSMLTPISSMPAIGSTQQTICQNHIQRWLEGRCNCSLKAEPCTVKLQQQQQLDCLPSSRKETMKVMGSMAQPQLSHRVKGSRVSQIIMKRDVWLQLATDEHR